MAVLEQANEAQRIADAEAKRKFAEEIERAKLKFVERQIRASELATVKALQLLEGQIDGDCAAKLLQTAFSIGSAAVGMQGANLTATFNQQASGRLSKL